MTIKHIVNKQLKIVCVLFLQGRKEEILKYFCIGHRPRCLENSHAFLSAVLFISSHQNLNRCSLFCKVHRVNRSI